MNAQLRPAVEIAAIILLAFSSVADARLTFGLAALLIVGVLAAQFVGWRGRP